MKIRQKYEHTMATREFTDREEPRKAFWKKYNSFKAEMDEGNVCVLTYYGIGGIGKSSLLKKLRSEMDERIEEPLYLSYNFEIAREKKTVLEAMRNILADKYRFSFPLFDIGVFAYGRKIGLNPELPEVKAFIDRSPVLGLVTSIIDLTGVVGLATKVLSITDKAIALVRNHLNKHKQVLLDIEAMEAADLYNYLPYLFACDMATNLEKKTDPLVIFLDTYEMLVNELSASGNTLDLDLWLRGEEGLVQNMPNTLWVIAGREKLKWEQFDKDFSEALEQHIVGNLSKSDGVRFLQKAGVRPEALCEELYDLTHGTPVYLDFCVDRYNDILSSGDMPTAEHFGKDVRQLVSRFALYMDDSKRDFVYMLALLGHWDDGLIDYLAPRVIPSMSISTYEKIKGFSFVSELSDGRYSIHQTVSEILLADSSEAGSVIRDKITKEIIPYCDQKTDEIDPSAPEYLTYMQYMIKFDERAPETLLAEQVYAGSIYTQGRIAEAICLYETLRQKYILICGEKSEDAVLVSSYLFTALASAGRFVEAKKIGDGLIPLTKEVFGEESEETLEIMLNTASFYNNCGIFDKAITLGEETVDKCNKLLGKHHSTSIMALSGLAMAYAATGDAEKAVGLNLEAYENSKECDVPEATFVSVLAAVNSLHDLGRFEEALEYSKKATELAEDAFENDHPNVLISRINYGRELTANKRAKEAVECFTENIPLLEQAFGENAIATLIARNHMADALESLGKKQEALEINLSLYPILKELYGEDYLTTQKVMADIERLS